jgi:cyclophilin family peptidyl-prolyl cis-trans isomerase
MTRFMYVCTIAVGLALAGHDAASGQTSGGGRSGQGPSAPAGVRTGGPAQTSPGAGPVVVIDTAKGTIEFETYPAEAPKTVEHILTLVRRNFYNGHRVHRVEPGFVVQFGDPQTRDFTKREFWGMGGSGKAVGVLESNPKRPHGVGAVALAHPRNEPEAGDSQMYITLAPQPQLNKDFTVFGRVITGMEVVRKLQINDVIKRVSVKGETRPRK